jgi:YhcH/YjgK/YiaL family protein
MNYPGEKADPSGWSNLEIDEWFEKGDWKEGWSVKPDDSIDRREFAVSWFNDPEKWKKAFDFLNEMYGKAFENRRYEIDKDKVYAIASSYTTKNEEDARYEAHRRYIDIQYIISGKEVIGCCALSNRKDNLKQYDAAKDIEFFTVTGGKNLEASPDNFFIFFPTDAHRPGLKDGNNSMVQKMVVKVMV